MILTTPEMGAHVDVASRRSLFGVEDGEEDTATVEGSGDHPAADSVVVEVLADSAAAVEVLVAAEPVEDGSRYPILR